MRKFLILAATTAALSAAPAFAQSAVTGNVDITGSVAGRCQFTTGNAVLPLGELSQAGNGELDTGSVNGQGRTLVGWCNDSASEISVEAQALVGPAFTANSAFSNTIHYKATATAGTVSANDTSSTNGAGNASVLGLFSGDIDVVLSEADAAGKKLVAGNYSGQVIVTLTPKFAPVSQEL